MKTYITGIIAGLIATAVLSVLMLLKGMMGMMPDLNVIQMLAGMMGRGALMGWIAHFTIGAIYGLVFAQIAGGGTTGTAVARGVVLGVVGWLAMMIVLMPMAGGGVFGLAMPSGVMVPIATLMLHGIFGAVLGFSYAKLTGDTTAS
ncbi:MAG: DUF2938 family protein [Alphaproteobacteria bacterium]|nr:MAG: DUF2938 family protein [Alphaproteobacteria bacterium]